MNIVRICSSVLLLLAAAAVRADDAATRLQSLNDTELRGVSTPIPLARVQARLPARSLNRSLFPLHGLFGGGGDAKGGDMGAALFPLLGVLNADVTAKDVVYAPNGGMPRLNADGSVNLPLPASIGELDLQNIRTSVNDSANFGAVQIRGIDLSRTVITIAPTR